MKFKEVVKKVENSKAFHDFKKHHKKTHLAAGFFVLDFESGKNTMQVDYATSEKIATFYVNDDVKIKIEEKEGKILPEVDYEKMKIDLPDIEEMAIEEMRTKQITQKLNKIIAILQIYDNLLIWNLTCMIAGFNMLRIHINASTKEIIFSEKSSMFDFIKRI